eukprot:6692719-Pyramimonas_sp.AAC.1
MPPRLAEHRVAACLVEVVTRGLREPPRSPAGVAWGRGRTGSSDSPDPTSLSGCSLAREPSPQLAALPPPPGAWSRRATRPLLRASV